MRMNSLITSNNKSNEFQYDESIYAFIDVDKKHVALKNMTGILGK